MNDFFQYSNLGRSEERRNTNHYENLYNNTQALLDEAIKIIEEAVENKAIDMPKLTVFLNKAKERETKTEQLEEDVKCKEIKQAIYKKIDQIPAPLELDTEYEFECPFCNGKAYFVSRSMRFISAKCYGCGYNKVL